MRGAVVRPDGTVTHIHHVAAPSPTPPFRGWWNRRLAMAEAVVTTSWGSLAAVQAVGIANQRASTIVWDRASGVPVGPGLGWQRLRTVGSARLELQGQGIRHLLPAPRPPKRRRCSTAPTPTGSGRSGAYFLLGTVDIWVAGPPGGALHAADATNAGVTGLLRGVSGSLWSAEVMEALAIPAAMTPTIVDSSGPAGTASILPAKAPLSPPRPAT